MTTPSPWTAILSPREREVIFLYQDGAEATSIAAALHISVKTVGVHLYNIRDKMRRHGLRFVRVATSEPRAEA